MEPIVFNVKDKSANTFFAEHAIQKDYVERKEFRGPEANAYYLMKDEILLKKSAGIAEGQQVVFELADEARYSMKSLVNTYTYTAEKYDDVSIKLKLIDFKVTLEPTS